MSFLTPLFLLAGLAVAFPIVFHLIRRTTRQRTQFSSLMFLFPTPPRLTQRSRLEHIVLLLLRCAALFLLAVGFSRPFFRKPANPSPSGSTRHLLILVDTSASMRRANLWADAGARIQTILRHASPADQLAMYAFDRVMRPLITFDQWQAAPVGERAALAMRALSDNLPGWGSTRLDTALLRGAEILADAGTKQTPGPSEIILISDLQEGSHLELLQGSQWPRNVRVSVELLKPHHVSNASLQLVADPEDGDPKAPGEIRVRISNATDSKRDQFKIGWVRPDGLAFEGNPEEVYVPPGQNRVISLPSFTNGAILNRVLLKGDEEDFDNSIYVLPPEVVQFNVLYFGAEPATDPKQPLYFLKRAFQETRREIVRVRAQVPNQPISETDVVGSHLIIVGDSLPGNVSAPLRSAVNSGRTLLFVVRDKAMAPTLAAILGLNELNLTEAQPANYAMLGEIDLRDPLFAPFADPRFSDFTGIHFWKYRRADLTTIPQAHPLARFDNGDPALFEIPAGKGRILVLTSGWDPQDSQLALSSKFVPLLYSILETSGAPTSSLTRYLVGDTLPISSTPVAADSMLKILTPDNREIKLTADETNFSGTLMPGIYTLASGQVTRNFAVNLDPSESRTAPLAVDDLERLGVPLKHGEFPDSIAAQRTVRLNNAALENHQKLWRWLIVSALLILLLETWLAGTLQRRARGALEGPPVMEREPVNRKEASVSALS